jgi:hypothetical protein
MAASSRPLEKPPAMVATTDGSREIERVAMRVFQSTLVFLSGMRSTTRAKFMVMPSARSALP